MRISRWIAAGAALSMALGLATAAQAVVVVDQDTFETGSPTSPGFTGMLPTGYPVHQTHLQTFTVGVTGTLEGLDLKIQRYAGAGLMEVVIFDNGYLGDQVGAYQYVPVLRRTFDNASMPAAGETDVVTMFDFSTDDFEVTAGQVLSFSVRSAEAYGVINGVTLSRTSTDYAGGKGYISSNIGLRYLDYGTRDIQFRTRVDNGASPQPSTGGVPEPATWALMIGGFGLAGAALRRRECRKGAA